MKAKYMIAVAALFLAAVTQTQAQDWQREQNMSNKETLEKPALPLNNNNERDPFTEPPSYAAPPDGGDGQKIISGAPILDCIWILAGLTIAYGFVCKKRKSAQ